MAESLLRLKSRPERLDRHCCSACQGAGSEIRQLGLQGRGVNSADIGVWSAERGFSHDGAEFEMKQWRGDRPQLLLDRSEKVTCGDQARFFLACVRKPLDISNREQPRQWRMTLLYILLWLRPS